MKGMILENKGIGVFFDVLIFCGLKYVIELMVVIKVGYCCYILFVV